MANLSLKMPEYLDILQVLIKKWPSVFDGHFHYTVGLSGGIDSVVLLFLMSELRKMKDFELSAIHVNHGISSNSDSWEKFCQDLCDELNISLNIARLKIIKTPGQGLENTARISRYKEYAKHKDSIIVLAHHQDDLIETMLSQMMRGSNIHNIAGMSEITQKNNQTFWRPLLNFSKEGIVSFARMQNLLHIEDESNHDNTFLRNFIRNKIIPEFKDFDPDIKRKLLNSLGSIQNSVAILDELANDDFTLCLDTEESIRIEKFRNFSVLRQRNLLAFFIKLKKLPLPSQKQLEEFRLQILAAAPDRHPSLQLTNDKKITRKQNKIKISDI